MYPGELEVNAIWDDEQIKLIDGVTCSKRYCTGYGCIFPDCARFTDEVFDTEEEAREKYPTLRIIPT